MRIFPTPPYKNVPELLDSPGEVSERDLSHTLRDIRRANIFGMGTWVVKHHLKSILKGVPREEPLRILDLATGSGDIPEELCRWGRRNGYNIRFVLTDISPAILEVARERIMKAGLGEEFSFSVCDACSAPFDDKEFDVVLCSLALHHLDRKQAKDVITEMHRLSRRGFVINDVYRAQGAWLLAWLLTHLTTTNRLTRHDGPASVLRAFTPREVMRIAERARVPVKLHTHPFWRMAAVWHGDPNNP
ncbi:MAG TPA: methyltransferase domain-containing protein [Chloroflexia bacterium]|nr:methyltransferase domain-containing protein [Chloroflexia bacterium]